MGTFKPHSKGPLYSNTVIGTLAVGGWAVTFGTAMRGVGSPLIAVPNVTAHPSTASVPTSYYSMWHYNYRCPLKGYPRDMVSLLANRKNGDQVAHAHSRCATKTARSKIATVCYYNFSQTSELENFR